jgi:hypothetical protein
MYRNQTLFGLIGLDDVHMAAEYTVALLFRPKAAIRHSTITVAVSYYPSKVFCAGIISSGA